MLFWSIFEDHSEGLKRQKSIKYAHEEVWGCERGLEVMTNEIAKNNQVWHECGHLFVYVICQPL